MCVKFLLSASLGRLNLELTSYGQPLVLLAGFSSYGLGSVLLGLHSIFLGRVLTFRYPRSKGPQFAYKSLYGVTISLKLPRFLVKNEDFLTKSHKNALKLRKTKVFLIKT